MAAMNYKEKHEKAKLILQTELMNRKIKRLQDPKQEYDLVNTNNADKRRTSKIETKTEDQILDPRKRLRSINFCRDLERNFTAAKSIIKQFRLNVVGRYGGKLMFNSDDKELNLEVSKFFGQWSKDCESRDFENWNDVLKNLIASIIREGDILIAFDNFDEDDGRLIIFEADQLVSINKTDWENQTQYTEKTTDSRGKTITIPMKQSDGVIYNKRGRVQGYIVSAEHGQQEVKLEKATLLSKDIARLVKNPFRPNQLRGISEMMAAASDFEDIYEMRSKELQSAKVAATFAGTITKVDGIDEAVLRGGESPETIRDDAATEATSVVKNYDALEYLTGGAMEYMLDGEKFDPLNFDRPNVHMKDFFEFVQQGAGAGFGLSKCYTTLTPAGSYTAFRGDLLLSWQTFYNWQKLIERRFCDWIGEKVLTWAMRKGKIKTLPDGWENMMSWLWPDMPQVDEVKTWTGFTEGVKSGAKTFSEQLGPDWENKLKQLSGELDVARKLNIPLAAFESKGGTVIEAENNNNQKGGDDEQD